MVESHSRLIMPINKKIKHQKEYFNQIASGYSEANSATIPILEKVKEITDPFIKGDVLDIGNGGVISFNTKKARSVTLADLAVDLLKNPRILDSGKLKTLSLKQFKFMEANVMKMPFKDSSFNTVLMLNVAHHLSVSTTLGSRKNVGTAMTEIRRVLKKNSTFIFLENCPTPLFKLFYNLFYSLAFQMLKIFQKPLPYFLSENEIVSLLRKNKFRVEARDQISWGSRVYLPIFPLLSPPGWLWSIFLKNKIFICNNK